jgi:hypothetical protein
MTRTTKSCLLDDPWIALVRRDAEHLIIGAGLLSARNEGARLNAEHDPSSS